MWSTWSTNQSRARLERHADLAHDDHVERRIERTGHLRREAGAPPRGSLSTTTFSSLQMAQPARQPPPCINAFRERHDNQPSPRRGVQSPRPVPPRPGAFAPSPWFPPRRSALRCDLRCSACAGEATRPMPADQVGDPAPLVHSGRRPCTPCSLCTSHPRCARAARPASRPTVPPDRSGQVRRIRADAGVCGDLRPCHSPDAGARLDREEDRPEVTPPQAVLLTEGGRDG